MVLSYFDSKDDKFVGISSLHDCLCYINHTEGLSERRHFLLVSRPLTDIGKWYESAEAKMCSEFKETTEPKDRQAENILAEYLKSHLPSTFDVRQGIVLVDNMGVVGTKEKDLTIFAASTVFSYSAKYSVTQCDAIVSPCLVRIEVKTSLTPSAMKKGNSQVKDGAVPVTFMSSFSGTNVSVGSPRTGTVLKIVAAFEKGSTIKTKLQAHPEDFSTVNYIVVVGCFTWVRCVDKTGRIGTLWVPLPPTGRFLHYIDKHLADTNANSVLSVVPPSYVWYPLMKPF